MRINTFPLIRFSNLSLDHVLFSPELTRQLTMMAPWQQKNAAQPSRRYI